MKKTAIAADVVLAICLALISISFSVLSDNPRLLFIMIPIYVVINVFSGVTNHDAEGSRLRLLYHGALVVCMMLLASVVSCAFHAVWYFTVEEPDYSFYNSLVFSAVTLAVPFINGIVFMYITSVQLRIKWRVLGILLGLIVPINVVVLGVMLKKSFEEVVFESEKVRLNRSRAAEKICATKYPILLVHGIFFRDMNLFRHWGRIPGELTRNGAEIYYGNGTSSLPVAKSAEELARRIREIVAISGRPKVNIIAYSKGGLDARYAIEHNGIAPMVASLITVSSPHRGCQFLDFLLKKVPLWIQRPVASLYNAVYRLLGDAEPDVLPALHDLTPEICNIRNEYKTPEEIYTRSFCSIVRKTRYARFPMTLTNMFAKRIDGKGGVPCDCITNIRSYEFGERCTVVMTSGKRGISHADMIDLNRENIKDFDVREFYVQAVAELKQRGL